MTKPPTPIRLTITVTPEVHEAFGRMAQVSGMSLGRCMGEWLGDTLEGVQMVTSQMERARQAPREVIKEMRQQALGILDEADQLVADARSGKFDAVRELGRRPAGASGAARPADGGAPPRLVIRGGKSTKTNTTTHKPRGSNGR